ncbi:MAG: lipoyl(octanoyl) transferase LipB [Propionibacteriaceae bacterium]|nr:lipoyl(octanoyl) transferase LipB [Propionibacteriaceae bacterium]
MNQLPTAAHSQQRPHRAQLADARPVQFHYLGLGERLVDFTQAWEEQLRIHAKVAAGELGPQVIFVEHAPVYTAGARTLPSERPFDGSDVVEVNRGGKLTYHGPGQLVCYPIVFLPNNVGIIQYVRGLEEVLIRVLSEYGLQGLRIPERTGVWLQDAARLDLKIAAIGIRVSNQTTLHGFALNISTDLERFSNIIPCGIADAGVTSLEKETGQRPALVEVAKQLEPYLSELLRLDFP